MKEVSHLKSHVANPSALRIFGCALVVAGVAILLASPVIYVSYFVPLLGLENLVGQGSVHPITRNAATNPLAHCFWMIVIAVPGGALLATGRTVVSKCDSAKIRRIQYSTVILVLLSLGSALAIFTAFNSYRIPRWLVVMPTEPQARLGVSIRYLELTEVQRALGQGADPNFQYGWNGFFNDDVMQFTGGDHPTALILALDNRYCSPELSAVVSALLDHGADIDSQQSEVGTALVFATHRNLLPAVEILLERGGNVTRTDGRNMTPLLWAVSNHNAAMVKLLLRYHAPIGTRWYGTTPLIAAAENGFADVVKILLDWGANPNERDKLGHNALYYATQVGSQDCIEFLRERVLEIDRRPLPNQ